MTSRKPARSSARRFGPGVAVHALLEWSARNRWRKPDADRVANALREQGLEASDERVAMALELTTAFLDSSLREEIGDVRVGAEVPFVLSVAGTLIRGSIDLLVERPDGSVLVVDYKTDRLGDRDPEEIVSRYSVQRDLYALAAAARGAPVETAYVFLERPRAGGQGDLRRTRAGRGPGPDRGRAGEARGRPLRGHPAPPPGPLLGLPRPRAALQPRRRGTDARRPDPPIGRPIGAGRTDEPQLSLLEGG